MDHTALETLNAQVEAIRVAVLAVTDKVEVRHSNGQVFITTTTQASHRECLAGEGISFAALGSAMQAVEVYLRSCPKRFEWSVTDCSRIHWAYAGHRRYRLQCCLRVQLTDAEIAALLKLRG